jgi:Zn-dependent protease
LFETILYVIPAILIAITIHEASHALAAYRLGDHTSKALGRLSLNPLVHLDPMGTIMIVFTAINGFGIGWGKPVPVNPYRLRMGPKTGMAIVSAAGPASNIATAFLLVLPERMGLASYGYDTFGTLVYYLVAVSIGLAVFNLLPLPPLDGFKVALGVLPGAAGASLARLEQYGPGLLLLVLFADWFLNVGILSTLLRPLRLVVQALVFGNGLF